MITTQSNVDYRSLSQIFTPTEFRRISRTSNCYSIKKKLERNLDVGSENLFRIIRFLYSELQTNYRSEYIYKNSLLNQKLLSKYSLDNSIVLNEFRVGGSIADFIILNGEIKIFEIKTDLDGFDKLAKQIEDYQKFADKVSIVVSSKNSTKFSDDYENTSIGVIELSDENVLKTIKSAETYTGKLEHEPIFKTLRKTEYLSIISQFFGPQPDIPNTQIFRRSLSLVKTIDVVKFQELARESLKSRNLKCPNLLISNKTPKELKHLCYILNLSEIEYENLHNALKSPI